jgi:hypothetical protein
MKIIILLISLLVSISSWGQAMKDLDNAGKTKFIFEKLTKDSLYLIDEFYSPDVDFVDPVGTIKGSANIKKYYESLYKNVKTIRFDFSDFIVQGDQLVGVWKMTLVTDKLNGGEPIVVDGNSVIRFNSQGQAIYHRDYFDMGVFVYENIPVLGRVIKGIKNRFKVDHE